MSTKKPASRPHPERRRTRGRLRPLGAVRGRGAGGRPKADVDEGAEPLRPAHGPTSVSHGPPPPGLSEEVCGRGRRGRGQCTGPPTPGWTSTSLGLARVGASLSGQEARARHLGPRGRPPHLHAKTLRLVAAPAALSSVPGRQPLGAQPVPHLSTRPWAPVAVSTGPDGPVARGLGCGQVPYAPGVRPPPPTHFSGAT